MISKETEEEFVLTPLVKRLQMSINGCKVGLDFDDPYSKDVEWFEVFFVLDPNAGDVLSENSIDGWQSLHQIVDEALAVVCERYADAYEHRYSKPFGIGVFTETEWIWGDEVLAIEAMVGTLPADAGLVGCWRFAVRWAPRPRLIEGRCLSAEPEIPVQITTEALPSPQEPQFDWRPAEPRKDPEQD